MSVFDVSQVRWRPLHSGALPLDGVRRSQSKTSSLLGETEVLLPAGRRFANHHPALAQILEMGKGRKASGMRQGWVQADIDPGDEGRNRLRAVRQRVQDRGFALAPVMD